MEGFPFTEVVAILFGICMLFVFAYEVVISKRGGREVKRLEKQIFAYCKDQGFKWEMDDGLINIYRRETVYRVFLCEPEKIKSVPAYLQYCASAEELKDIHWIGMTALTNYLSDRHTPLNISANLGTQFMGALPGRYS